MKTEENKSKTSFINMRESMEEDTIDLVEIFYYLLNNIVIIGSATVILGIVAFLFSYYMITPLYESTTKMYMVSSSSDSVVDLTDLQIGTSLSSDYTNLLASRTLMEEVIEDLKLDMEAKELSEMVKISNPSDTRIMEITVTSADPQQAADIANSIARQAKDFLPDVMHLEEPSIYEIAKVPVVKASPSLVKNTMIGLLLGFVLSCGVYIVLFLMNDMVVTPDDLERYFGIKPLATIAEVDAKMKQKIDETEDR